MMTIKTSARLLPIYAWSGLWSKTEKEHRKNSHFILHFPMSEGVSEVSEQTSEWAQRSGRAKRVVQSKRTSEWCEWTSGWMSEWSSSSVWILGCSGPQWSRREGERLSLFPSTLGLGRSPFREISSNLWMGSLTPTHSSSSGFEDKPDVLFHFSGA